ncbi:MAG: ABC transporter substrate-binding protein [Gammaproteobacteria bacterium]
MNNKKRNLIPHHVLLLICLLPGMAMAVAAGQGPVEMLQDTTDEILRIIKDEPQIINDQARLREIASDIIYPHVDFTELSRWVLGKHWRDATPAQRQIFINEFRELLLNTYLRSVTSYQDNTIRYQPMRQQPTDGRAIVHASIEAPGAPLIKAEFRLHQAGQEWLIYDVAIDGVSLVVTQRSSFSEFIRREGIDGLIARLESRNTELKGNPSAAPVQSTPQ